MFRFDVIEDVEMNDSNGGWIKVLVIENVEDCEVEREVMLSFDFGESLSSIDIVGSDDNIEDVFSKECCDEIRSVGFMSIGCVKGVVV